MGERRRLSGGVQGIGGGDRESGGLGGSILLASCGRFWKTCVVLSPCHSSSVGIADVRTFARLSQTTSCGWRLLVLVLTGTVLLSLQVPLEAATERAVACLGWLLEVGRCPQHLLGWGNVNGVRARRLSAAVVQSWRPRNPDGFFSGAIFRPRHQSRRRCVVQLAFQEGGTALVPVVSGELQRGELVVVPLVEIGLGIGQQSEGG